MTSIKKWSREYEKCKKCNTTEHPYKAKGLCTACYQKEHLYPQISCSICGMISRVHKRVDGKPICQKCYKEPIHICSLCSKESTAAYKLNKTEFVCDICYKKYYRKKQLCQVCCKNEYLAINNDSFKICIKCYSTLNNECSKCGRNIKSPYVYDGNHICKRCYNNLSSNKLASIIDVSKQIYICSICGKHGNVYKIYTDGSIICSDCYNRQSGICALCNNSSLHIYSHINALPYCRNCYYKQMFMLTYNNLKTRWASGSFISIMNNYFINKSLLTSDEEVWKHIKSSASLLNELYRSYIDNDSSFTYKSIINIINKYPRKKLFINDFIAFLYAEKLIYDYDSSIGLINNSSSSIYKLPLGIQKIITYYKESLLCKLEEYMKKGWIKSDKKFNYYTCYLYILTALRFFSFICNSLNIQQITEINNNIIESYLSQKPYDKGNLRHLIKFINRNKLTFVQLSLPSSNYKHQLQIGLDVDKQNQVFNDCIYNNNISLRDRVLVVLMLLYGMTPKDIIALNKVNFKINKTNCEHNIILVHGNIKHSLPTIISSLVIEYLETLDGIGQTIFPGRFYNTSISLSSICRITSKFMTTATELHYTSINNSMLNGLYQPALIAKIFNINPATSARYFSLINYLE